MYYIRRIDDMSRIVIPKEIRKLLDIKKGDELKIYCDNEKEQIIIEKNIELRKDDPIYYRNKIRGLIKQAFDEGLGLDVDVYKDRLGLTFEASNGDKAEVIIINNKVEQICKLQEENEKLKADLRGKDNEINDLKTRIAYLEQFKPKEKDISIRRG